MLLARNVKPDELDQAGLSPLAVAIRRTCSGDANESQRGLATIKALVNGGCSVEVRDSQRVVVRNVLTDILRNPDETAPQSDSWRLRPFEIKPKQYLGPVGLDATKLSSSPVLREIQQLLMN